MPKLLSIMLALAFITMFAQVSAFAQKKSCAEVCLKRCEMSSYGKNLCIPNCTAKCNQTRATKK
jgi:hypothetical protein